jgi:hypothetical protein
MRTIIVCLLLSLVCQAQQEIDHQHMPGMNMGGRNRWQFHDVPRARPYPALLRRAPRGIFFFLRARLKGADPMAHMHHGS